MGRERLSCLPLVHVWVDLLVDELTQSIPNLPMLLREDGLLSWTTISSSGRSHREATDQRRGRAVTRSYKVAARYLYKYKGMAIYRNQCNDCV